MGFNESLLTRRRDELRRKGGPHPVRRPAGLEGAEKGAEADGRVGRADREATGR